MNSRVCGSCDDPMAERANAVPLNRPNCREVLERGGCPSSVAELRRVERGTGLTPLWKGRGGSKRKRCVPSPLTHRTPRRWRAGRGWLSPRFIAPSLHYSITPHFSPHKIPCNLCRRFPLYGVEAGSLPANAAQRNEANMDKNYKYGWLVLTLCQAVLLSGCTSALWEKERFARCHWPANPPNLRLFYSERAKDVLAEYDEVSKEPPRFGTGPFGLSPMPAQSLLTASPGLSPSRVPKTLWWFRSGTI